MKTLICAVVLALVISAIASPAFLDNRAAINSFDKLAEIKSSFDTHKKTDRKALWINEEDLAKIQAAMNQLAEIGSFWSSL